jgi:hypothetical protein
MVSSASAGAGEVADGRPGSGGTAPAAIAARALGTAATLLNALSGCGRPGRACR